MSFLDHILTTSSFVDYEDINLNVETVMIEDFIGGYDVYEEILSDHRPVIFSIPFSSIK